MRTVALVTSRLQTAMAAARFCGLAGRGAVVAPLLVLEELEAERLRVVLLLVLVVLVACWHWRSAWSWCSCSKRS